MIYGEYRFGSDFFINPQIRSKNDATITMLHEGLHFINTMSTPYGLFIYILSKVNGIDPSKSFLLKKVRSLTLKSHEAVSTFSGIVYVLSNEGKETANTYIEDLRENNKEYYKYVERLIPLLNYTTEYNDKSLLSAGELFLIIRLLFSNASSVDVLSIDYLTYRNEAQLNKVLKKQDVLNHYSPDIRFNKSIKDLSHFLSKALENEQCNFEHILNCFDEKYRNSSFFAEDENEKKKLEIILDKQKDLVCCIYEDSPFIDFIRKALSSITIQEKDIETCFYRVSPLRPKLEQARIINCDEIEALFQKKECSIFVYQKASIEIDTTSYDFLGLFISFMDPEKGSFRHENYVCPTSEFVNWYQQGGKGYDPHLIISYSLYSRIQIISHNNIFTFCDKPYEDIREDFITLMKTNLCRIIEFENIILRAVIIKVKENHYYVFPFISETIYNMISKDIATYSNDSLLLDIDANLMKDIDFMINSLYNVEME